MDDYIDLLKNGTIKLHSLEGMLPPDEAVTVRRRYISEITDSNLDKLGEYSIDIENVVKKNCENMIGTVQVPVGVAGPLKVKGTHAEGDFYVPLATTEGALVASVNRGCSAITKAGGAEVVIQRDGMTRAPVFAARNTYHALEIAEWVEDHFDELCDLASTTTSHGSLVCATPYITGTSVFVRLEFSTGDAMGMNMVTIAGEKISDRIAEETGAIPVALSGNMCTDKKPAAINLINGRGKTVIAGVFLSDDMIRDVLKTDSRSLFEVNYRKNLIGSARAGALGFNAHAANIIAAIFIACGQDPAHVVEGSNAITTIDPAEGGVYASVTLPSLQVGTVGGGTGVGTQRECLGMLGCAGGGDPAGSNARKFAEIIASAVLGGEVSLLGALAARHLARAHRELGRAEKK